MALSSALLACAVSLIFSFFNGIEDNNTVCTIEPSASLIVANPRNFIAVDNSPSRLRNGSFARAIAVLCFNGITCQKQEKNCGYAEHEYFIYHYIYLAVVSILALFAALKLVLSVILLYSLSLIKFAKPKAPGQELFFRTVQLEPSVADMQCCPNIALALRSYGSELF